VFEIGYNYEMLVEKEISFGGKGGRN
jgi:hypothetical protein